MSNYPTTVDVLTQVAVGDHPITAAPLNGLRSAVVATETVVGYGDTRPYVLCLGDSITEGSGVAAVTMVVGGYRKKLYDLALANGTTLRYVGPITVNSSGMTYPLHAGFSGKGLEYIADAVNGVLTGGDAVNNIAATPVPKYVIVDAGNNDVKNGIFVPTLLTNFNANYAALINAIAVKWVGVTMILTTLGRFLDNANGSYAYMTADAVAPNNYIRGLDTSGIYSTQIAVIDTGTILSGDGAAGGPPGMLGDGLHPNDYGYQIIANAIWHNVLSRIV